MEPKTESGFSQENEEFVAAVVRRHVHDVRNHLNGVEMEASLLEELSSDPMIQDSLKRLRIESGHIEAEIRSLYIRFAEPNRSPFAVVDLFNLWQSRCMALVPKASISWECSSDDHQIHVDGRLVADALSEKLLRAESRELHASARSDKGSAVFEIRESEAHRTIQHPELPGLEHVIERNGGQLTRTISPDQRERVTTCRFPLQ